MSGTTSNAAVGLSSPSVDASIAQIRVAATNEASLAFFSSHADQISQACHVMAGHFSAGGRLLVYGQEARQSDVAHVVVEFMHPVVVGKRALPTLSLSSARDPQSRAARGPLETIGRRGDILMIISDYPLCETERDLLDRAGTMGMLTIALTGATPDHLAPAARFTFAVSSADACIVQETHEMLYHVLWELVHVFLEHRVLAV